MAISARVILRGRALIFQFEDPSIDAKSLGPLGNYVRVDYNIDGKRIRHEGAIRGYGTEYGHELVERVCEIADRLAKERNIGPTRAADNDIPVGTVRL